MTSDHYIIPLGVKLRLTHARRGLLVAARTLRQSGEQMAARDAVEIADELRRMSSTIEEMSDYVKALQG